MGVAVGSASGWKKKKGEKGSRGKITVRYTFLRKSSTSVGVSADTTGKSVSFERAYTAPIYSQSHKHIGPQDFKTPKQMKKR